MRATSGEATRMARTQSLAPRSRAAQETRDQAVVRRLAELVSQRDWTLVEAGRSLHDDLGQVLTVKETAEGDSTPQPFYGAADALRSTAKSIAIRPGQQPVTIHLAVVWSLA